MLSVIDPNLQASIIKLVIAWALVGAFIFTLIVTCISLIRPAAIPNVAQQRKLFVTLIVELVVICLGAFSDLLKLAPHQVQNEIAVEAISDKAKKTATPMPTATPLPQERTTNVKVVSVHVGGDDAKSDTFTYDAPTGYVIKDYKLLERAKGGDAHYSARLVSPTKLEIKWSVKSKTVRGPFKMLLNTITAFLDLEAQVTIQESSGGI